MPSAVNYSLIAFYQAVTPPSMAMVCPVIYELPGDKISSMVFTTSCGSDKRLIGVPRASCAWPSSDAKSPKIAVGL